MNNHVHHTHPYTDGKPISQVEGPADVLILTSHSDESNSLKSEVAIEQLVPDGDIKNVESIEETITLFSQDNDVEHKGQPPTIITDQSISLVSNYKELTVKIPETLNETGNENNLLIIPELVSGEVETKLQTIDVPVEECVQISPSEYNGECKRTTYGLHSLFEDKAEPLELESEDEEMLINNEGDNEDALLHETGSQSIQNRSENAPLVNGNDNECLCSPLDETEHQSPRHENEDIVLSNKHSIEAESQSFQNENISVELSNEAEHQTLQNNVETKEDSNLKDQLSETESHSYENRNVTNEETNSPQDSEISSDLKLDILSSFICMGSDSSKTSELFSFSQPLPLLTKTQLIEMLDRGLHDQLPRYSLPSVFTQSSPLPSSPPSKRIKSIDQVKQPSHPEELSNDGYDTVNQNLPTESAHEYAIVPQHCQNKDINNDDKNDPSDNSSLDIANVPNCNDTTHSNDSTVIVPSIPTKTTATIVTTHSLPEQSCNTPLYENFIESSITSLVESDLPSPLKTALKSNPTWSHRVFHNGKLY